MMEPVSTDVLDPSADVDAQLALCKEASLPANSELYVLRLINHTKLPNAVRQPHKNAHVQIAMA